MEAATGLMDGYFLPMAARVLGDASVPEDERDARTLAAWIMATVIEKAAVAAVAGDPAAREHVLGKLLERVGKSSAAAAEAA